MVSIRVASCLGAFALLLLSRTVVAETAEFTKAVHWDLSNGTHVFFWLKGDGSRGHFDLEIQDAAGNSISYGPEGSNKDFLLCAPVMRKLKVDLVSDKPVSKKGDLDWSRIRMLKWTVTLRSIEQVSLGEFGFDHEPSLNERWEKQKGALSSARYEISAVSAELLWDGSADSETKFLSIASLRKGAPRAKKGNFIRVSSDNWNFEESKTGRRYVPMGCNYYGLNVWPPDLFKFFAPDKIDEDFGKIASIGANTVRIAFLPIWITCPHISIPTMRRRSSTAPIESQTLTTMVRVS